MNSSQKYNNNNNNNNNNNTYKRTDHLELACYEAEKQA